MTAFEHVGQLPPNSLVNFVSVLARNNFGDAKLLLAVNQAILNKQKDLTTVDMSMLMGSLYDLDRVTEELNAVFQNYF